jgi:ATP:ADP antiporter, AAA family
MNYQVENGKRTRFDRFQNEIAAGGSVTEPSHDEPTAGGWTGLLGASVIVGLFAWLAVDAGLWPLMVAKVVQEIVGYGLLVPAQHVLFTVVSRAEKYESKAFVDTVVFRGSDVVASNVCDALQRFSVSAAALALVPLAAAWMALGAWLGREQAARSQSADGNRNAALQQTSSR